MTGRPTDRGECALWHMTGWDIHPTEESAARATLGLEDAGGWAYGVQFPDGTLQGADLSDDWPMYDWVVDVVDDERAAAAEAAPPPPVAVRYVEDPFSGAARAVHTWDVADGRDRPWLGARREERRPA